MKRLAIAALVVLGCNYYGPDNPPPDVDPPPPSYLLHRVDAVDPGGIATAVCPAGSLVVSGGGDCAVCGPVNGGALFGNNFNGAGEAWSAACYPGCAHATAYCLSSSVPGTLAQSLGVGGGTPKDLSAELRAVRNAKP